ncbi:MAG: polynucleotide adenylyltransferase [Alphaproteobacteria bacterium PA4]|nr:MAG: polynucleotide adenylyltransferase [Alphaproteobacteria bacterium PA4]
MRLATPDWVATPGGAALLAALDAGTGTTRLVGGAVRDGLLGRASSDVDLATQLRPEAVIARLQAAGLKAVPTGLAHGTVTAVAAGLVAEVTTLRRDVATDGRHAEVAFTDDWQADASRRDFTINALYATLPGGEISDFFGGAADLAARRVRFIGDPLQRIAEDHLRILRFFRFSARYAEALDGDGLAACTVRANDLMALSRERIALELRGLLAVADPLPVLAVMLAHGIWRPVLPEIAADRLPVLARTLAAEAASGLAPAWQRRLAALLPADAKLAETVAARLRLSNADRARLALAVQPLSDAPVHSQAWALGTEAVVDRLLVAGEAEAAMPLAGWQRPRLPVAGRDVLARGFAAGPPIARILGRFERLWVAAGFPDDPAAVTRLLDQAAVPE